MMRRDFAVVAVLAVAAYLSCETAQAQWYYPRGYGRYGLSRWGADPAAGYMAGLGAFARGQGAYQLDKAKADAINVDTMIKWNKALRARQAALREEQRKEAVVKERERESRVRERELEEGVLLNGLLMQVLDADPGVARSGRFQAPLSNAAIKEIPFEWDSEAITLCIDQMTGAGSLPVLLMDDKFAAERAALRKAVEPALKEDRAGSVSPGTSKKIQDAVDAFRAKFAKNSSDFEVAYQESQEYFNTLASLTRLLNDPSMRAFLKQLDDGKERTVGDLVAFMNAYNLRFGPATSDRQVQIYRRLVPALQAMRDAVNAEGESPSTPDRSGSQLRAAAKGAFKSMRWDQLEAHAKADANP